MCKTDDQMFKLHCKPAFDKIDGTCTKIFDILEGNGQPGLKTKVAILEEKIKTLRKWRVWSIGIATTIGVGVCIRVIWTIASNVMLLFGK